MHILISDYSGHPFQVQLSRELARRGHRVTHLHFAGFQTPKGNLTVQLGDPELFAVEAITLDRPFAKTTFVARWRQENEVGRLIAARIAQLRPDVVISSNAPLDTQRHIQRAARRIGRKSSVIATTRSLLRSIANSRCLYHAAMKWPATGIFCGTTAPIARL